MITYDEFKEKIKRIIRSEEEDSEENIIFDISRGPFQCEESRKVKISKIDIVNLYNIISGYDYTTMEMHDGMKYEIAVDVDPNLIDREKDDIIYVEDEQNGITYKLGEPSKEYCAFMIAQSIEFEKASNRHIYLRCMNRRLFDIDNIEFEDILKSIFKCFTLTIESKHEKLIDDLRSLKNSFVFQSMYKSNYPLIEISNIEEISRGILIRRDRINYKDMEIPPFRKYNADLIDYYKLSMTSKDAYIQFISYYHIIEYYYDEIFRKNIINDLRSKITSPDFSYKNDDDVYGIASYTNHRLRQLGEDGRGNEFESLKYVLREFVNIDELQTKLNKIGSNLISYYQNNKVAFCKAKGINWNDNVGIYDSIAKRIYTTRNSLIHSKEKDRYKPYSDEKELQKEIPLIKIIAEMIIINTSEIL